LITNERLADGIDVEFSVPGQKCCATSAVFSMHSVATCVHCLQHRCCIRPILSWLL
jgi:hypothetical protein